MAAFVRRPDAATQDAVHEALVALRDWFFPHLDLEDEKILPAIAESIPPKQWAQLDKAALKSIPRKHLPSAVAALDEVIRSLPEQDRPAPPPPPIRIMLSLSWRKTVDGQSEAIPRLTARTSLIAVTKGMRPEVPEECACPSGRSIEWT